MKFEKIVGIGMIAGVVGWSLYEVVRAIAGLRKPPRERLKREFKRPVWSLPELWAEPVAYAAMPFALSGTRNGLGVITPCPKKDIDPKRPGHKVCLYSRRKPRKLLGRHKSRQSALRQERAIWARKG